MRYATNILLMLGLTLVFTMGALIIVLIGADVYKKIVNDMDSNYEKRTPLLYIAAKIRENDRKGQVSIASKEGRQVLVLSQKIEETDYETWIYEYKGELYELLIEKGTHISLKDGISVVKIQELEMERQGRNRLRFESKDQKGESLELTISLRSEGK